MPMGHHRAVWSMQTVASAPFIRTATDFAAAGVPGTITFPVEYIYIVGVNVWNETATPYVVELQEKDVLSGLYVTFDKISVGANESKNLPLGGPPPMRIQQAAYQLKVTPIPITLTDFHVTSYMIPLSHVSPEFV